MSGQEDGGVLGLKKKEVRELSLKKKKYEEKRQEEYAKGTSLGGRGPIPMLIREEFYR